jgi:hypothetical protein
MEIGFNLAKLEAQPSLHNVGRASSPARLAKAAWKLAKLQAVEQICSFAGGGG